MKRNDLTGKIVGRLTVIALDPTPFFTGGKKRIRYLCKCECGNVTSVLSGNLISPKPIMSCGCLKIESTISRSTTHNMSKTRLNNIWYNMKSRCINSKLSFFKYYGGKGIKVCDEWKDFKNFYDWAMNTGYNESLTIERINVDGNYEPSNCMWATRKQQANNTTNTCLLTLHGETKSVSEWCDTFGLPIQKGHRLYNRHKTANTIHLIQESDFHNAKRDGRLKKI